MYDQGAQDIAVKVESRRQSPGGFANESKITFLSDVDDAYRQTNTSQLDSVRQNYSSKNIDLPFSKGNQETIKVDRHSAGSFMNVPLSAMSSSGTLGQPPLRPSVETPFHCDEQSLMCLSSSPSVLRASNLTYNTRESDLLRARQLNQLSSTKKCERLTTMGEILEERNEE